MAVTMRDVAREAGVSAKTVSNALSGYPYMRPETRERVLEVAERLNYVLNRAARSLKSGRTGALGLALPDLRNAYFAELADAVTEAADRRGFDVLVRQTRGERERELDSLHGDFAASTDGVLLNALALSDADRDQLAGSGAVVLLGDHAERPPCDHVTMHNVEAAAAMTEHLLASGRQRIVVIGAHHDEVIGSAGLRLAGVVQAHAARGLVYDEDLIGWVERWHRSDGARTMAEVVERVSDFDAVFGLNDMLALGAMRELQHRGVRVPDDVAVAGFDDLEESGYSLPALTTINPGVVDIAERAVGMLVERTLGFDGPPRQVRTDFSVVVRESA